MYSFEEGEYVYFLFYETAIEVRTEQVYSRVARICKNDIGSGQEYFSNYFLSYRLVASSQELGTFLLFPSSSLWYELLTP